MMASIPAMPGAVPVCAQRTTNPAGVLRHVDRALSPYKASTRPRVGEVTPEAVSVDERETAALDAATGLVGSTKR
jgi:hypothetical protein